MAILVSNMHGNSVRGIEDGNQITAAAGIDLARSCVPQGGDRIRVATLPRGIERIEARFHGNGFSPHRHDTYALGVTMSGIQTFSYRGSSRFSRPGCVIVLHPDEVHDGGAGTDDGLVYRMVYLPPSLIAEAAGEMAGSLPFVADPVVTDVGLRGALLTVLEDLAHEPQGLLMDDALTRIAAGLCRNASVAPMRVGPTAHRAVLMCRDYIDEHCEDTISSG